MKLLFKENGNDINEIEEAKNEFKTLLKKKGKKY